MRVTISDAYSLKAASRFTGKAGVGICEMRAQHWEACRVTSRTGGKLQVVVPEGKAQSLEPGRVLSPSALTRMNIESRFSQAESLAKFTAAAQRFSEPKRPPKWTPRPRERVLGRLDGQWYTGSVHEIEDAGVRMKWRGSDRVSEVPFGNLAPEPPYRAVAKRGEFALLRPEAEAGAWRVVRVESTADGEVKVVDAQGKKSSARRTELVPMREP
jgi:hypothetical protein